MKPILPLIFLCLLVVACAQGPTVVSDSDASLIQRAYDFSKTNRPIKITPETVVLDVRPFFDYQLLHVPNSLYVNVDDYSLRRKHGDDLQAQATKLSRRFALMGIHPFSHVVVVGNGTKGKGEEGVLALTLLALGVERVQIGTFENSKFMATTKQVAVPANRRYWEPRVVGSVVCPAHDTAGSAFVIEVNNKSAGPMSTQRLATISRNWKEFVNAGDSSPNPQLRVLLKENEISENARIHVRGAQAPFAVFSLLQLGYANACMSDD